MANTYVPLNVVIMIFIFYNVTVSSSVALALFTVNEYKGLNAFRSFNSPKMPLCSIPCPCTVLTQDFVFFDGL